MQYDRFDFQEIEMAEIPAQQLLQIGLLGLFPLALLAKDGAQAEIIDTVATTLAQAQETELLSISYTLGSLMFPTETAKQWYKRRFSMFEEMIRDTWVYEEIGQERFEKGIKEGIEEGLREGELQGLREAVLELAHTRFPEIETSTKRHLETIRSSTALRRLVVDMSTAPTAKEAALAVLVVSDEEIKP